MSLNKTFVIHKVCLGLLISYSAAWGQPMLLTGPIKNNNLAQINMMPTKDTGIYKLELKLDPGNISGKPGLGYSLMPLRIYPFQILAFRQELNIFFTARAQKPVEAFCLERVTERMNLLRINANNQELKY